MKNILKKAEFLFDYYFAWMFYNGGKRYKYIEYMENKYNKKEEDNVFETCIMCGKKTKVLMSTHIDHRIGYIEGAGQLCMDCFKGDNKSQIIEIDKSLVINTPNNYDLGEKVRELYWESLN